MFGMRGFYVSASGAIQGHHGPLVQYFCENFIPRSEGSPLKVCNRMHMPNSDNVTKSYKI